MSADSADRRQLGELLVEKGVLTDAQLQLALAEQEASGTPLGEILVRLGFTKGPTIGNALAEQHGGPLRTEYGLALGPTSILGMPPEQTGSRGLASHSAAVGRLRIAEPTREQDTAIARLTAALNERTQELERVQTELSALEQHRADLATARVELEELQRDLTEAREERTRTEDSLELAQERLEVELETVKAERTGMREDVVRHENRVRELEHQLEQERTRQSEAADAHDAHNELRLAREQHKAELATAKANLETLQRELTQVCEERTHQASRADELEGLLEQALPAKESKTSELAQADDERTLRAEGASEPEQQLEQARAQHGEAADAQYETQRALVAAARARAQRGYGPALRTASTGEAGRDDDGHRDPPNGNHEGGTVANEPGGVTIRLWQPALFFVLGPLLLYVLVPVNPLLAAASVVLLATVIVMYGRRTSRAAASASADATDGADAKLPAVSS